MRRVSGSVLRATAWLVAGLWLWTSCADDGSSGDPASGGGFCHELAQLFCERALACDCFEQAELDDCEGLIRLSCWQEWQDQVDKGYQEWDAAAVDECLAEARVLYTECDPAQDLESVCGELTYGVVPAGGTCDGRGAT